jgi:ribosomal protein L1
MDFKKELSNVLVRQQASTIKQEYELDKMIEYIKKRYELRSIIHFPLSTCNFKKQGVLQNITLLFAEFILV